jgi:hypothetical protein
MNYKPASDCFPQGYLQEEDMNYQRRVAIALMRALIISAVVTPLIASLPLCSIRICLYLLIACDEIAQTDYSEEIARS